MTEQFDKITEPQEWIDGLIKEYAPNSEDIDVALQNMGLRIKALEKEINDHCCADEIEKVEAQFREATKGLGW